MSNRKYSLYFTEEYLKRCDNDQKEILFDSDSGDDIHKVARLVANLGRGVVVICRKPSKDSSGMTCDPEGHGLFTEYFPSFEYKSPSEQEIVENPHELKELFWSRLKNFSHNFK